MTTNQPLSLFISSKMAELAEERRAVQSALSAYQMRGWLFEQDAGARPEPIQSTYLTEVEACDIYIGLFWLGYGPYTIQEYEQARALHKPCLVYEKQVQTEQRDPLLTTFLQGIQRVTDPQGVTVFRFSSVEALQEQVQRDVLHFLVTTFRQSRQQPPPAQVWNVPFRRNPFFTGREQLLTQLHENLTQTGAAALTQAQAISGLSGIGKTQFAVEYAYRYRDEYHFILWVRAATYNTLISDFVALADMFHLREKDEQDQNKVVVAVKRELATVSSWLLIFDNADDLALVNDFLPTEGKGHILLTTRTQAVGTIANRIEVEKMDSLTGTLLLLRRARVLAADFPLDQAHEIDRISAEAIVKEMDALPLALDQAGAYIEETGCSVSAYLERYRQRQETLLKRRGGSSPDHPEPVASTWSLSFEQIERDNPIAADLLRFSAFLAPDAIPEEMITEGAAELGEHLQSVATDPSLLDEAIGTLRRFSLVRRNSDNNTYSLHRLVQIVLKESTNEQTQRQWAEKIIRALNRAFPNVSEATWAQCQRYLPHVQVCAELMNQYQLVFPEAARLLDQAAIYLDDHALYPQAELLFQQALAIREKVLPPEHAHIASSLNNLGWLYQTQGKYEQAEPLFKRSLAIREKTLGPEHPTTANSLNNLAVLYRNEGKYEQAEPLFKRSLAIREKMLGPEHPTTAISLNDLANLYCALGKYQQAEPLYQRALSIKEKVLGPEHPSIPNVLQNYADLLRKTKHEDEATALEKRANAIRAK
jgi:tetratricopeptide (TPR) repeat protein